MYAPEIEGSLYPQTFEPLNINNFTGILRRIKMVQGIVPGISQSMTYLGKQVLPCLLFIVMILQAVRERLFLGTWRTKCCTGKQVVLRFKSFTFLFSFNYLHFGAGKVWYAAAAREYEEMVEAFRALYPEEYIHCVNAHMHKEFFVHPDVLRRRFGLKMFKTVQRPGELICTRPRGFHAVSVRPVLFSAVARHWLAA